MSSAAHATIALAAALLLFGYPLEAAERVPLIDAVQDGDVERLRTLLGQGANVASSAVDGTTALHWAVHRDDLAAASLLIDAGADVSATNRYGVAPISLAATNGSAAMIERLLGAGADVNASLPEGETVLMTAARTGRVDAVEALLAHGAHVDVREQWKGQTALMWAAAQGHTGVVRMLIDYGAVVDARSGFPETPEVAPDADGANADAPIEEEDVRRRGFSAFLFAVRGGHLDAAAALLEAGADIEDTAPDGSSALVVAVDNRNYELAAWLLEGGADPNADGVGWAALHVAVLAHRPHFRTIPDPLPTGTLDGAGMIAALVAHGADPNQHATKRIRLAQAVSPLFDALGSTPFMLAAIAADIPVMQLLLEHGADPGVTTPAGATALMAAAGAATYAWQSPGTEAEALEAVKLVLASGVDVNQTDEDGNTALHGAANRGANSVIQLLLDHGAQLDAVNQEGWMPVTVAQGPVDTIEPFPETYAYLLDLMTRADKTPPDCPQCSIGFTADASILEREASASR